MSESIRNILQMLRLRYRADRLRTILTFSLSGSSALMAVLGAYWLKIIVDGAIAGDLRQALLGVGGILLTDIVQSLTNWTGVVVQTRLVERLFLLIDQELMELASGIPYLEHHERTDYLKEMDLLREQKRAIGGIVFSLVDNFTTLVQAIAVGLLLARIHPILLALPVFALPSLFIGARVESMRHKSNEDSVELWRASEHLFELATTAGPAKELRIFGLKDEIPSRHSKVWADLDRLRRRADYKGAALSGAGWLFFAVGYIAAIFLVVLRAVRGEASPGDVILALRLTGQVNEQVSSAVRGVSQMFNQLKTVKRYRWLVNYAKDIREKMSRSEPASVPAQLTRGIDLREVTFVYPGTDATVLEDINLHLPAGSTVAIVGDNGAGKTTLAKLLSRFYEPTSGVIEVDGVDFTRFDVEEWRSRTSAGFQDFVQFEFLARQTVGVGDLPRVEHRAAVSGALDRAEATDVLPSLPSGLETQLGKTFEGGVELSGGQWQKLALGRAMMREEPLLLILDEPTSSLDAETEHALFERYAHAASSTAKRTGAITVLVSHRFSTVRMADLIVVFDSGKVTELGSHEELMALEGTYAELFELQARRYR